MREKLLEAGTALLKEEGLEGATLRKVAARAGVSHGAPRHYFPTFTNLLGAIARNTVEELNRPLVDALTGKDARKNLKKAAQTYLEFAQTEPSLFDLLTRHDLLDGAGGELRQFTARWVHLTLENLSHIRTSATEADAVALWANIHGLAGITRYGMTQPVTAASRNDIFEAIMRAHGIN